jgi:hypothetical protein
MIPADVYDDNGNTVSSGGTQNSYDFENHLIQHGAVLAASEEFLRYCQPRSGPARLAGPPGAGAGSV